MKFKIISAILLLFLAGLLINFDATASPVASSVTPVNNSNQSRDYVQINLTSSENLSQANVSFNYLNGTIKNISMTNSSMVAWGVNITGIPNTPAAVWHNYTILMLNTTGTWNTTGLYNVRLDNQNPIINMDSQYVEIKNLTGGYYNNATLWANITDNSTHTCIFRVWTETLNSSIYFPNKYWTLSTTNFTGTLTADAATRNCTYNLTGNELGGIITNGVVLIEAWANDSVSRANTTSVSNVTIVFNTIPAAQWTMLGNVHEDINTSNFTTYYTAGNLSYVSVFNNTATNKTYHTYAYGLSPNENKTIDNSSFSGFMVYSTNGWKLMRVNNTYHADVAITNGSSAWNLVGVQRTNTTKSFAKQGGNITYVSYYNASAGYYYTYREGYTWNENVTVHRGESVWVNALLNDTWSRT